MCDRRYDSSKDYYSILRLPRGSVIDLKRAYYERSLEQHPDKMGGCEDFFKLVVEAYEVLSNPQAKRAYDRERFFTNFDDDDCKGCEDEGEEDIEVDDHFSFGYDNASTAPPRSQASPSYPGSSCGTSFSTVGSIGRAQRDREPRSCTFDHYYFNDYTERSRLLHLRIARNHNDSAWRIAKYDSDMAKRRMEAYPSKVSLIRSWERQAMITSERQIKKRADERVFKAHLSRARSLKAKQRCLRG